MQEEEDKYDKVAVGMEKADDRLYMRDITGYWTDINFYNELPNTFKDASRDPRANHMAAKLRLQEDAEAAGKFGSLQVSDTGLLVPNTQNIEEGVNPKSILKRKENQVDPKTQKRVRFGPGCNDDCEEDYEGTKDVVMGNCSTQAEKSEASFPPKEFSVVPDYIRNPSKYTHYTFDSSSDSDEESNQKASLKCEFSMTTKLFVTVTRTLHCLHSYNAPLKCTLGLFLLLLFFFSHLTVKDTDIESLCACHCYAAAIHLIVPFSFDPFHLG